MKRTANAGRKESRFLTHLTIRFSNKSLLFPEKLQSIDTALLKCETTWLIIFGSCHECLDTFSVCGVVAVATGRVPIVSEFFKDLFETTLLERPTFTSPQRTRVRAAILYFLAQAECGRDARSFRCHSILPVRWAKRLMRWCAG